MAIFGAIWIASEHIGKSKKVNNIAVKYAVKNEQVINIGKYIGGHPELDKQFAEAILVIRERDLTITNDVVKPVEATIPIHLIDGISIEDASTMKSRVTAGRVIALGVFAFATPKQSKTEISYLTIEWHDFLYNHCTIFEFYGVGSNEAANTVRNRIINFQAKNHK
jgi:hypothetical protein